MSSHVINIFVIRYKRTKRIYFRGYNNSDDCYVLIACVSTYATPYCLVARARQNARNAAIVFINVVPQSICSATKIETLDHECGGIAKTRPSIVVIYKQRCLFGDLNIFNLLARMRLETHDDVV